MKDYLAIDALLENGETLENGLHAAAEQWDGPFNAVLSLKALCYFDEGDLTELSDEVRRRLQKSATAISIKEFAAGRTLSLEEVAHRVVWYKAPAETLSYPEDFLAHLMTYGVTDDIVATQKHFTREDFLHALENAPPGVFDVRSWTYWNTVFGRVPVPEMPRRRLE